MVEQGGGALLTADQMRAAERAAIASGAVTGLELMERAGRAVLVAAFSAWPALAAARGRALVLCGPGNNGGDGYVAARLLKGWGWQVEVRFLGDPARLPPDARANHESWAALGGLHPWDDAAIAARLGAGAGSAQEAPPDLVIDALFGIGIARPMPAETAGCRQALRRLRAMPEGERPKLVAVDTPSGLCAESGADFGAFPADLTVTFHRAKPGHYLSHGAGSGPELSGRLQIADIGLEAADPPQAVRLAAPAALAKRGGHKYAHGHALVLAGGPGRGGAGRLAARAALRIGAGLVTLGCPGPALAENAAQLTAVMLREIGDWQALGQVLEDRRINALCLGPGLGLGAGTRALVLAALRADRALVLDADALASFAQDPAALFAALAGRRAVLTPHGGEFARLFPALAAKLEAPVTAGPAYSRLEAARAAAAQAGCTVLLKGPDTVIADPGGACRVNAAVYDRAVPWLATAGAGDVLAGLITGLLARGFAPMQAAETAAWLHAECARSFGPGLIAEDLPEALPQVLRAQGA